MIDEDVTKEKIGATLLDEDLLDDIAIDDLDISSDEDQGEE